MRPRKQILLAHNVVRGHSDTTLDETGASLHLNTAGGRHSWGHESVTLEAPLFVSMVKYSCALACCTSELDAGCALLIAPVVLNFGCL